jgi:hypothetical protein
LIFTFRNFGKGVAEAALGFPLKEGTGENTLVQTTDSDNGNKAITENSIALGEANIAGAMGYYFTEIFYGNASTNPQIRVSLQQPKKEKEDEEDVIGLHISPSILVPNPLFEAPDYVSLDMVNEDKEDEYTEPDIFSLICNDHFALFGKIVSITNDVITFTGDIEDFKTGLENMESKGVAKFEGNYYINLYPEYDDYTLCVPDKPLVGVVEVCKTAMAQGYGNISAGEEGMAHGANTKVVGAYGHASGKNTLAGYAASAEGADTQAPAKYSHAQNKSNIASGYASTATGHNTKAKGKASLTGGGMFDDGKTQTPTEATEYASVSLGEGTLASGEASFATGLLTKATNKAAQAAGMLTRASGYRSFAGGWKSEAEGMSSFAFGEYAKATAAGQFAVGNFNKENKNALFIVGNGTSDKARSNAFEVLKDGGVLGDGCDLSKIAIGEGNVVISRTAIESMPGGNTNVYYLSASLILDFVPRFVMINTSNAGTFFLTKKVATDSYASLHVFSHTNPVVGHSQYLNNCVLEGNTLTITIRSVTQINEGTFSYTALG